MSKIKVAVIGYGRSGKSIHANLLSKLTDLYEIAAFVDADPQRREMIKAETGAAVYADHKELYDLKGIGLVVNASFSHHHARISKELMENGFDVLSEKPAAKDAEEFAGVLETQARTGRKYFVFQQYRFSPAYIKIKEVINSGVLGRIVHVGLEYSGFSRRWDWQTVHDFSAGSLLNTGPHPLDHALDLMGFPQNIGVFCAMDCANAYGGAEDYVKLILRAEGAPVADIEISGCNAYAGPTFLIQGTKGTLKGDTKALEWKYFIPEEAPARELLVSPLRDENGEPIYCRESLDFHEGKWEAAGEELDDFTAKGLAYYRALYNTLTNGAAFPVTNGQILVQMEVIGKAHAQNEALFAK